LNNEEIKRIFEEKGALLFGHFLLSSGMHSSGYLQCALVLQFPSLAERLAELLSEGFDPSEIDVVVSPALGGIIIGHEVARAIRRRAIFCEREKGKMKLRRGFRIRKGERCLVIEDVFTTGGSIREVMENIKKEKGEVAGVGVLVDRSKRRGNIGVRFHSLLKLNLPLYKPEDCPLCKEGVPLRKPGSR